MNAERAATADGWLVLDKPPGITSAACVGVLRRLLDSRKAGHAGTLDPFATGVLPVAFGEATKTAAFVSAGRKRYRFTVAWGEARDTDDATGAVIARSCRRPGAEAIADRLASFTGEILQRPPDYSAVRVDGKRAYALARRGKRPRLQPRPVTVHALRMTGWDRDRAEFDLTCGSGTYVRSLARDLGESLDCLAYVRDLRRLAAGPFDESDSLPLADVRQMHDSVARREALLPVAAGLADIPALAVGESEARQIRRGMRIVANRPGSLPDLPVAWASFYGRPVAIGRIVGGVFRPSRVFPAPYPRA